MDEIKRLSCIYAKGNLTRYQVAVNQAAEDLCLRNPSLVAKPKRQELIERSRKRVHESGYLYTKGKSRSKVFGVAGSSIAIPKRRKIDKDARDSRMKAITEELKDLNERISYKEKRCQAGVAVENYKLCDQIKEETSALKQQRRQLEMELKDLQKRDCSCKVRVSLAPGLILPPTKADATVPGAVVPLTRASSILGPQAVYSPHLIKARVVHVPRLQLRTARTKVSLLQGTFLLRSKIRVSSSVSTPRQNLFHRLLFRTTRIWVSLLP